MRTLQMIMVLVFALSLTACAHKEAPPTEKPKITLKIKVKRPEPKVEGPKPKSIGYPALPGFKQVGNSKGTTTFYNEETTTVIALSITPTNVTSDLEMMINELYQVAQSNEKIEVSEIGFSENKSAAYFSFGSKPTEGEKNMRKGKIVILLLPEMPEVTILCMGSWPAEIDKLMVLGFDRFWNGIGLVDTPADTK